MLRRVGKGEDDPRHAKMARTRKEPAIYNRNLADVLACVEHPGGFMSLQAFRPNSTVCALRIAEVVSYFGIIRVRKIRSNKPDQYCLKNTNLKRGRERIYMLKEAKSTCSPNTRSPQGPACRSYSYTCCPRTSPATFSCCLSLLHPQNPWSSSSPSRP